MNDISEYCYKYKIIEYFLKFIFTDNIFIFILGIFLIPIIFSILIIDVYNLNILNYTINPIGNGNYAHAQYEIVMNENYEKNINKEIKNYNMFSCINGHK